MTRVIIGLSAAILFHGLVLLFGGIFFMRSEGPAATAKIEEVDLLGEEDGKEEEKKKEEPVEQPEEVEEKTEEPIESASEVPDLRELARLDAAAAAPALDAVSLGALEDLMNPNAGQASGDFFTATTDLASGGRIGGTGAALQEDLDSVFAVTDLDQKPTPVFQTPPTYPYELRRRKIEGTVSVRFVVDETGRVTDPKIENSTDPAFEKAALDAIKQWKFEPAVRGGQKVKCKMHVPLRFSVS